jgi:uncharacterized protein YggU (UPF0235/DUF167 family)
VTGGGFSVAVLEPARDGEVNRALLEFLAPHLGVAGIVPSTSFSNAEGVRPEHRNVLIRRQDHAAKKIASPHHRRRAGGCERPQIRI